MSWTVACFCGHLFSTPPHRCPTCGETLPEVNGHRRDPDLETPASPVVPADLAGTAA